MKSKHFEKLDVDGDGYLTREEMKSARKKAKERYKKMREKRQD
ncbi:MAG TPA: hypothetical protein EYQ86_09355 [Bacteroidetes bacterium]|nr:hypothetical protein [Bacteroidota bacterium]